MTETTTLSLLLEQGLLLASELTQLANITPPSMLQVVQYLQIYYYK